MTVDAERMQLEERDELLRSGDVLPLGTTIVELLAYGFSRSSAIEVRAFALVREHLDEARRGRTSLPADHPAMLWATDQLTSYELVKQLAATELQP